LKKKRAAVIGIILLLSISVLCFFSGCGSNSNSAGISTAEYDHAGSEGYTPPESGIEQTEDSKQPDNINIEQKIIKNGSLTIETSDLSQAEENIASLKEKYEGYINDSNLNILKSKKEVFMTVKVPEKNFEKFYEEIKEIGNVERSQIGTRDVTTEYIDLKARLETQEAQEKRLVEMYSKASTIEEMLKIENELTRIRTSIESISGQIKYLDSLTDYSTLTIQLYQQLDLSSTAKVSFKDGWNLFINAITLLAKGILLAWPFIILAAILYGVYRYRKHKQKQE
jgi:hypothetical protein